MHNADYDAPGWRLGPHRWDWLRSLRCLLTGRHEWTVNPHQTQRVCYRCWTVQDRVAYDNCPPAASHTCGECRRVIPPGKGGQS